MRKMIAIAAVLGLATAAGAAQSPGQKCQSSKNQEAGNYASCRAKAEVTLLKTEGTCSLTTGTECHDDGDCPLTETCTKDLTKYAAAVTKCEEKFEAKWNSLTQKAADALDPCPDGLPVEEVKDAVDEHVANVAAGLAGEGLNNGGSPSECGNGTIDAGEDCDLGNLNGGTCTGEGFAGGLLGCGVGCVYDTSACYATRFEDNGNGTISDHETGLMWEKKIALDGNIDIANLQDADVDHEWAATCSLATSKRCQPDAASEAACLAGVEGSPTGCAQCTAGEGTCMASPRRTVWEFVAALNAANFGGHDDWRVPTRQELSSILDMTSATSLSVDEAFHGASCGGACTDVNDPACSCTQAYFYWSATSLRNVATNAWSVLFEGGAAPAFDKSERYHVRAVRGGS